MSSLSILETGYTEAGWYLPAVECRFFSVALWSDRSHCWVPMLFTDKRDIAAGQAARAAEGGFTYWVLPFDVDDERLEVASWRAVPPPDSAEFRAMLSQDMHGPDDPNR